MSQPRTCIGIVCIGERYLKEFEETFKPSVISYANKYGYDLKIFTDFIGQNHPDLFSFEKCLVPYQLIEYDCVVVMDADIYIHDYTPPIHLLASDKIGIVNEVAQITEEEYRSLIVQSQPIEYYSLSGFNIQTNKILNTGVMLCNPSLHAEFMKSIYDKYSQTAIGHSREFHYEQSCTGYELQTQNMFSLLPSAWNNIFIFNDFLKIPFNKPYFVHFAGLKGDSRSNFIKYLAAQRPKNRFRWGIHK
jgi:hypothetical protein